MKTISIKLSKEDRKVAEIFADMRESRDGKRYKTRRGAFKREDILCGALSEIAAFKYLHSQEIHVNYPDFTIHKKKSFGADLITIEGEETHFHVKGQTKESESKYGCSYLFQKSDKLITAAREYDYIICCVCDLDTNVVEIRAVLEAGNIIWDEPKIKWLERTKKALYLKDQIG